MIYLSGKRNLCNFILILFFMLPVSGYAQISGSSAPKNIIEEPEERASKSTLSTKIMLGGNYQTGNTEKGGITSTLYVSSIDSIKEFSLNGKFLFGENTQKVNQREYLIGFQYDYHPLDIFSPFARIEYYSNTFRQINNRYSAMAGMKYRLFKYKDLCDFSLSAALLFDLENYNQEAHLDNKERWRLSVRPKYRQRVMDNIYFLWELYYKPNLSKWNDYMIYSNANLNFKVNQYIFLNLSYEYEYNSRPATASVKRTDNLFLVSLGIEF